MEDIYFMEQMPFEIGIIDDSKRSTRNRGVLAG